MSCDITFLNNKTDEVVYFSKPIEINDEVYDTCETEEGRLSVVSDYDKIYKKKCNLIDGIRTFDHKAIEEIIPFLKKSIDLLEDNHGPVEHWEQTEGNAKKVLVDILKMAEACPAGSVCIID